MLAAGVGVGVEVGGGEGVAEGRRVAVLLGEIGEAGIEPAPAHPLASEPSRRISK